MFSSWRKGLIDTFGARLALWYFTLFAASALIVVLVAGILLQASLARRDRDALLASLVRYLDAYSKGGVSVLDSLVAADRAAATYEPYWSVWLRAAAPACSVSRSSGANSNLDHLAVPLPAAAHISGSTAVAARSLEVASARLRDGTLFQVGRSTARRDVVLDRYRETAFLLFAAIVLLAFLGGLVLTARALQPLHELSGTILRILQTGRTSERVLVRGTMDPLDALGTHVNRMLERIDGLVRGMRASLDNVAHDLRTPMTRLRGTAEMALQSAQTPEEFRDALADCLEEADRVTTLLDALMDLAEAETGAMRLRRDTVALAEVVRDAAELYAELAEEKGLTLTIDAEDSVPAITGDRARLRQVFANLIDNAVKYTPAPGRVTVTVRPSADGARSRRLGYWTRNQCGRRLANLGASLSRRPEPFAARTRHRPELWYARLSKRTAAALPSSRKSGADRGSSSGSRAR